MRDWLIRLLGGYTKSDVDCKVAILYNSANDVIWALNHQTEKVYTAMKSFCIVGGRDFETATAVADRVAKAAYKRINLGE